jgi:hypothetical protein
MPFEPFVQGLGASAGRSCLPAGLVQRVRWGTARRHAGRARAPWSKGPAPGVPQQPGPRAPACGAGRDRPGWWADLARRNMGVNCSWERAAGAYLAIYNQLAAA